MVNDRQHLAAENSSNEQAIAFNRNHSVLFVED